MSSPSPPLTRGNRRETAAKNIRRRGIFIIQIRFGGYFLFFCLAFLENYFSSACGQRGAFPSC